MSSWDFGSWELRDPVFLLLACGAPLVYYLARRRPSHVVYSSETLLTDLPRSWRQRLLWLPPVLLASSVILLAIGLARPRSPDAETRIRREGIAIMLVIDRSSSMEARDLVESDVSRNRLDVVKEVLHRFVLGSDGTPGRPDDLVGLITFAGYADSVCPLTIDHHNLASMIDGLEIVDERSEDGTAIGDGVALAVERLRTSQAKARVIVLLTDGVNNVGVVSPERGSELAQQYGVKVYAIGAGTDGYAPVPWQPYGASGPVMLKKERVEIDEATLQSIADVTGGKYFRATDAAALEAIYHQIDQLERSELIETRYLQYTEHFRGWLIAALGLLLSTLLGNQAWFRSFP